MSRITAWLRSDWITLRTGERRLATKRWHGVSVLLIAIIVAVVAILAATAAYVYPYKTVPRPPLPPGQTVPKSSAPDCNGTIKRKGHEVPGHTLGGCLPQPTVSNQASITATQQGPDLSNNDPVSCGGVGLIAAHNAFLAVKVNQGTYYTDRTAYAMAACARAYHLPVGGYDFMDVCNAAPDAEARVFVADARADGLLGPNTFLAGDAEYPLGSLGCNARSWIGSWVVTVHNLTGRWPWLYTGAWWWNPHVGTYWPGVIAWVSGYGVRYPYMPSGRSQLDVWQFADNGWNGATYADLSIWRDGAAAFTSAVSGQPPGPAPALTRARIVARGGALHAYYAHGCARRGPVLTSGTCGQFAWRVNHYQLLIDTAHGYFPRCFGHHRDLGAAVCQVVRPAVAIESRAAVASYKAFIAKGCVPPQQGGPLSNAKCKKFYGRQQYFQGNVNYMLGKSRRKG